jgi:hypothetical protein
MTGTLQKFEIRILFKLFHRPCDEPLVDEPYIVDEDCVEGGSNKEHAEKYERCMAVTIEHRPTPNTQLSFSTHDADDGEAACLH